MEKYINEINDFNAWLRSIINVSHIKSLPEPLIKKILSTNINNKLNTLGVNKNILCDKESISIESTINPKYSFKYVNNEKEIDLSLFSLSTIFDFDEELFITCEYNVQKYMSHKLIKNIMFEVQDYIYNNKLSSISHAEMDEFFLDIREYIINNRIIFAIMDINRELNCDNWDKFIINDKLIVYLNCTSVNSLNN